MKNRLTVKQIKQLAEKYLDQYDIVAIRTQEEQFSIGKLNNISSVWIEGKEKSDN